MPVRAMDIHQWLFLSGAMKKIDALFSEYGLSHLHPVNIAIHWIAVPAITMSCLGLLWSLNFAPAISSWLNAGVLVAILGLGYCLHLSRNLAIGFGLIILMFLTLLWWLTSRMNLSIVIPMIIIFSVAWVLQFIGHQIEGKRPSFLKDLQFLLVGPLWLLAKIYRHFHVPW